MRRRKARSIRAPSITGWLRRTTPGTCGCFASFDYPLSHVAEYELKEQKTAEIFSESHDVISAIDVNNFAGNAAAGVRGKKYSSGTDLFDVHVAAEWSSLGV